MDETRLTRRAMTAQGTLTIDLDAIARNWRKLAASAAPAECAAVVKADAYGLGAARVVPTLAAAGCRTFFVATLDEGVAVREALRTAEASVYVLSGAPRGAEGDFIAHRLRPVLNSLADVERWVAAGRRNGKAIPAALHIDTGMSRLGLDEHEQKAVCVDASLLADLDLALVMSHLACADEPDHPLNEEQRARFAAVTAALPSVPASLANSAGIFLKRAYHLHLVRPGVALYGGAPVRGVPNPMEGVVRLAVRILQVREIDSPRTVGYGATYQAHEPTRIATVAAGYADGYPRSLSNRGQGVIAGHVVPLVGRVSMDLSTFDVSAVPAAKLAQATSLELIGPDLPIDAVAAAAGTIAYEILTSLGRRYHRVYVGGTPPC
jgi:alanine racemase